MNNLYITLGLIALSVLLYVNWSDTIISICVRVATGITRKELKDILHNTRFTIITEICGRHGHTLWIKGPKNNIEKLRQSKLFTEIEHPDSCSNIQIAIPTIF